MNYPDQQTKKNCCIVLMATLFVGVYLRFYGLAAQGFFFFDEGEMFLRAKLLKEVILNKHDLLIIGPSYVDTKVFWLFLISVGQTIFKGASYSAHYVSALLGVLSIVLTYLVASRIYNSPKISLFIANTLIQPSYNKSTPTNEAINTTYRNRFPLLLPRSFAD